MSAYPLPSTIESRNLEGALMAAVEDINTPDGLPESTYQCLIILTAKVYGEHSAQALSRLVDITDGMAYIPANTDTQYRFNDWIKDVEQDEWR